MKKLLITFFTFYFWGCMSSPTSGLFYTNTTHHVYGTRGNMITSANIVKRSESCSYSLAYINYIFYGDGGSPSEAMFKSDIKKIAVIDRSSLSVLGIMARECVVIWGE